MLSQVVLPTLAGGMIGIKGISVALFTQSIDQRGDIRVQGSHSIQ